MFAFLHLSVLKSR